MKRIFLDTNILLDLLFRPEFSNTAKSVLKKGADDGALFCVSFLSLANFAYILRKNKKEELYSFLRFLCMNFNVLRNEDKDILNAMECEADDFEDAIQYVTAISGGCECIITRNKKDFKFSKIPILSPSEFIE